MTQADRVALVVLGVGVVALSGVEDVPAALTQSGPSRRGVLTPSSATTAAKCVGIMG